MSDEIKPTSVSPETNPQLKDRVEAAAKVMGITPETLFELLSELGIERYDSDGIALLESDTTQEGDARKVMVDSGKIKIIRFKAGWSVLKGKAQVKQTSTPDSDIAKLIETIRPISQWSDSEIIGKYGPECSQEIIDHLRKQVGDKPFVVFNDDGTVESATTLILLREARRGGNIPAQYPVVKNGSTRLFHTYRVNEFPMTFVEECPIHADTTLVNEYCDRCGSPWLGISEEDRIIVRVASDLKLIDTSIAGINKLIRDLMKDPTGMSTGAAKAAIIQLPKFDLAYREMKEENRLPRLRKRMSRSKNPSDPFYVHRTY